MWHCQGNKLCSSPKMLIYFKNWSHSVMAMKIIAGHSNKQHYD